MCNKKTQFVNTNHILHIFSGRKWANVLKCRKYLLVIRQNVSNFVLADITNITVEAFKRIETMENKYSMFLKTLYQWFSILVSCGLKNGPLWGKKKNHKKCYMWIVKHCIHFLSQYQIFSTYLIMISIFIMIIIINHHFMSKCKIQAIKENQLRTTA